MTQSNKFFERKREWSIVKDDLLTSYLKPYFTKILATGKPIIYIDGFAGRGIFEDGQKGSPLLAMETFLESVGVSYNLHEAAIMFHFIELKKDLFDNLQKCVDDFRTQNNKFRMVLGCSVYHGNFRDKLKVCLAHARNANVFLYLDPYGIKFYDFSILSEISKMECYSFEILCNFNSFGFFRAACRALKIAIKEADVEYMNDDAEVIEPCDLNDNLSIENLNCAFGSDGWREIIKSYYHNAIDGVQAEKEIAEGVHKNLRKYFKYVLNMPIRLKPGNVPKYRMYHATNNIDGCILMAQNMQKRKDRLIYSIQGEQQESLFGSRYAYSEQGDMIDLNELEDLLSKEISEIQKERRYRDFLAEFYTDHGIPCAIKEINEIMKEFEKEGKIVVRRIPALTNERKLTKFWSDTNKRQVFIRSK